MCGVVMYTAGDVRVEQREDPKIIEPTDAIVRRTAVAAEAGPGKTVAVVGDGSDH